jgi:hypothetical protein
MAFEDTDRRRTLLLALLTLVVLPATYFLNRADNGDGAVDADTSVATVASAPASTAGPMTTDGSSSRPPLEAPDDKPVFLDGPPPDPDPRVVEVAVPPRPDVEPLELTASYRRTVSGVTTCLVADVSAGIPVTVTNLDNGRSVECITAPAPDNQTAGIVLHTETFSKLADLTDAPVPVEVTQ